MALHDCAAEAVLLMKAVRQVICRIKANCRDQRSKLRSKGGCRDRVDVITRAYPVTQILEHLYQRRLAQGQRLLKSTRGFCPPKMATTTIPSSGNKRTCSLRRPRSSMVRRKKAKPKNMSNARSNRLSRAASAAIALTPCQEISKVLFGICTWCQFLK